MAIGIGAHALRKSSHGLSILALVTSGFIVPAAVAAVPAKQDAGGWETKTKPDGKVVQELKIEAPSFTEEDQYGYVMPDRYRCDSCRAVMFHLDAELRKRHPKSRRMKQWEYTDVFDDICRTSFEGYGIRLVKGENKLSGPGLKGEEDELKPGSGAIQMGGESWTKRLAEICRKLVYEKVGEDEIYERFYKRLRTENEGSSDSTEELGLTEAVCKLELRECEKRVEPEKKPDTKPTAEKDSKAKSENAKAKKEKEKAKAAKAAKDKAAKDSVAKAAEVASRKASAASTVTAGGSDELVDIQTFMRRLAVRHGLTSDEYLASRTAAEWERLSVAIAGRIFNRLATSEPEESCRAGAFGSA